MRNKEYNIAGFKKASKSLKDNEIILSQKPFYTVQGEGKYSGVPSIFVRTAFCSLKCHFCFVKGTKISTPNGDVSIEEIKTGDKIYSYNQFTNKIDIDIVEEVTKNMTLNTSLRNLINKKTDELLFISTEEHPIYSKYFNDYQWLPMSEATNAFNFLGDNIKVYSENFAPHRGDKKVPVYNLKVANNHNYFANKILVHNCDETTWDKFQLKYSYEELLKDIKAQNPECELLIFTGGEPALQLKDSFLSFFQDKGYLINIETSGSIYTSAIKQVDYVCCSPKRLSDQLTTNIEKDKYILDDRIIPYVDEFKFIIDSKTNEDMLLECVNHIEEVKGKMINSIYKLTSLYVSPMDEYNEDINKANLNKTISLALKYPNIFRINLQLHKILNMP